MCGKITSVTHPHAIHVQYTSISSTTRGSLTSISRQSKNLENLINENIFKQLLLYSIWPIVV